MTDPEWRELVRELASRAPDWMRERSSAELHIGGFTQVQLDVPVLEIEDLEEPDAARRATVFFLSVCLAEGVRVARIRCGRRSADLAETASRVFAAAIERLDDENSTLMRYFDVYLRPAEEIEDTLRGAIAGELREALRSRP